MIGPIALLQGGFSAGKPTVNLQPGRHDKRILGRATRGRISALRHPNRGAGPTRRQGGLQIRIGVRPGRAVIGAPGVGVHVNHRARLQGQLHWRRSVIQPHRPIEISTIRLGCIANDQCGRTALAVLPADHLLVGICRRRHKAAAGVPLPLHRPRRAVQVVAGQGEIGDIAHTNTLGDRGGGQINQRARIVGEFVTADVHGTGAKAGVAIQVQRPNPDVDAGAERRGSGGEVEISRRRIEEQRIVGKAGKITLNERILTVPQQRRGARSHVALEINLLLGQVAIPRCGRAIGILPENGIGDSQRRLAGAKKTSATITGMVLHHIAIHQTDLAVRREHRATQVALIAGEQTIAETEGRVGAEATQSGPNAVRPQASIAGDDATVQNRRPLEGPNEWVSAGHGIAEEAAIGTDDGTLVFHIDHRGGIPGEEAIGHPNDPPRLGNHTGSQFENRSGCQDGNPGIVLKRAIHDPHRIAGGDPDQSALVVFEPAVLDQRAVERREGHPESASGGIPNGKAIQSADVLQPGGAGAVAVQNRDIAGPIPLVAVCLHSRETAIKIQALRQGQARECIITGGHPNFGAGVVARRHGGGQSIKGGPPGFSIAGSRGGRVDINHLGGEHLNGRPSGHRNGPLRGLGGHLKLCAIEAGGNLVDQQRAGSRAGEQGDIGTIGHRPHADLGPRKRVIGFTGNR